MKPWYKKYKLMLELSIIYQLKNPVNHSSLSIPPASLATRAVLPSGCDENSSEACRLLFQLAVQVEDFKYAELLILTYSLLEFPRSHIQNEQNSSLVNGEHWNWLQSGIQDVNQQFIFFGKLHNLWDSHLVTSSEKVLHVTTIMTIKTVVATIDSIFNLNK